MIIIKEFNGQPIRVRQSDRYVCLTDMAKASGKLFSDWYRLKATTDYLVELSADMGIPITDENLDIVKLSDLEQYTLIAIQKGGIPDLQGTFGHRFVSLRFAQWLSTKFALQVDKWIDELLTNGKVELNAEQQKYLEAQKLVDSALSALDEVALLSPIVYETAKNLFVTRLQINLDLTASKNDLNSSLVANRLGLAFNKHLKAFDMLQDVTSPEAYAKLKKAYSDLLKDFQELEQSGDSILLDKIKELTLENKKLKTLLNLKTVENQVGNFYEDVQNDVISIQTLIPRPKLLPGS